MVDKKQKEIELKWQRRWKNQEAFRTLPDKTKEKYFATIAYPYANSVMHIGHGRTGTTADIYARYQRLKGKNVLYPMGFHITGTPVLAVADAIAKGDEKQIKLTRDAISDYVKDKNEQDKLIESFKEPMNIADFFSSRIEETFDSIGLGIDWSRQFTTGDPQYNKFIEWQFKKLYDAGILTQGKYPILYSYEDQNAVGEDDIKDGDTEKVAIQDMTFILFRIKDCDDHISVATLRPDALFGATNLWVNPKMRVVRVKVNEKIWLIAKEALKKVEHQYDHVELLSEHDGKEFIGKVAISPITQREVIVAEADFTDPDFGTGLVYSSPAGSPEDFLSLQEAKEQGRLPKDLEVINTVDNYDKKGNKIGYLGSCPAEDKLKKFGIRSFEDKEKLELAKQELYKEEHYGGKLNSLCADFAGLPISKAKDKIKERLKDEGLGGIYYETSRKATTRGGAKVIVAVLDEQWFLDYSKTQTKEKAFAVLDNIKYNPETLRSTQKGYLEWVQMRPCARKRGLGTRLPFDKEWVIEALSDSTIYQMFYLIADIIYKEKIDPDSLSIELFDYLFLGKGNPIMISESTKIGKHLIDKMRESIVYFKSFDLRYTAGTHMSNHLSFLIYHYGIIFEKEYWPNCITIGGLLIKDGEKISKSKGNGIPLFRIKDIYGADLYRLYVAVGANYDIEMDFRDEEIFQLEKKFNRWKYLVENAISEKKQDYEKFSDVNKWLISKFYSRLDTYFEMMEGIRIREAYVSILYEFLNDIAYHEKRTSEKETLEVLRFIIEDYVKVMTPVVPHTTEEFNEIMGNKDFVSLQSINKDYDKYISKEYEDIEGVCVNLLASINKTKESKKIGNISKITIVQAPKKRFELFDELFALLEKTRDFKIIMKTINDKFPEDSKFISKFVPKTLGSGLSHYMGMDEERKYLESVKDFLRKEFDSEVEIVSSSKDIKVNAIPGEPGVIVE